MLSLGRRQGETIMIGDDIMVKVIKCDDKVRLGIIAPKDLPVVRGELYKPPQTPKQSVTEADGF